jgi:putative redox protein
VLAASHLIPDARAVVTIAAPYDPNHVVGLFKEKVDEIKAQGEVEVQLAGRPFRIKREFLNDVAEKKLNECLVNLHKALLVFHSPTDTTVGIENASHIFGAAKHPKSFVSLTGADHLLSQKSDAVYVANVIAAWAERYLDRPEVMTEAEVEAGLVLVRETHGGKFQQEILSGPHRLLADEPVKAGGLDSGPGPYDFLLAGLGACTSMTLRLYAERKSLPLDRVTVRLSHSRVHATDCATCETKDGMIDRIERAITLEGELDDAQRGRLLEIADKCPVHRTLTSEIEIKTREQRDGISSPSVRPRFRDAEAGTQGNKKKHQGRWPWIPACEDVKQ